MSRRPAAGAGRARPGRRLALAWAALLAVAGAAGAGESPQPQPPQPLPAEFVNDRVFVVPRLADGTRVRFYTDSGGGWNMVPAETAARLRLVPGPDVDGEGGPQPTAAFPAFAPGAAIPAPVADPWLDNRLAVAAGRASADGFLGSRWFAARVWAFDYGARTLALLPAGTVPAGMARVAMTMRPAQHMYWPRIAVGIDGERVPMLLDTGATLTLADGAASVFGLPVGTEVAGSFITRTRFERWRARHPDWPVVEDGDRPGTHAQPMIRVPRVEIAGLATGPVWFAMRADANFTEYMSSMTDAPVEGAIGGSALRYFRMVLDYPGQAAYFALRPPSTVAPAEQVYGR
jgi:hypothetical protein